MIQINLYPCYGHNTPLKDGIFVLILYNSKDRTISLKIHSTTTKHELVAQFFRNKLPIGELLDHLDKEFDDLIHCAAFINKEAILQQLRQQYPDPTLLYKDIKAL